MMKPRGRVDNAKDIARRAFFFVKKAREDGHVNTLKEITILEAAEEFGWTNGRHYSTSTVVKELRELVRLFDGHGFERDWVKIENF